MTTSKSRRGRSNRWIPSKDDLARIIQLRANGATNAIIARQMDVVLNTLKNNPKAKAALVEGKELHEGVLLGQMSKLGSQTAMPQTAFNAIKWQLQALHGYNDQSGMGHGDELLEQREEQKQAELESLDAKLESYLNVEAKVNAKRKKTAKPVPPAE